MTAAQDTASGFRSHVIRECLAMTRYALATGRSVPVGLAQTLEAVTLGRDQRAAESVTEGAAKSAKIHDAVRARQDRPSPSPRMRQLLMAHERLSQIVAPATPQGILLLSEQSERSSVWGFLGPVPLIRRMMLAALLSLALFLGIGLFSFVDAQSADIFNSHGLALFLNEVFLLAAAGLGASFAALFQANRFIVEASYDSKHEPSYWIRFSLGVIAGVILAELIPIGSLANAAEPSAEAAAAVGQGAAGYAAGAKGSALPTVGDIARPTLAMLGGFSSAVVHRILDRGVSAIDSLFRGETREVVAAEEQAARARLAEQSVQSKMETLARLVALQQQISDGVEAGVLKRSVAEILNDYLGTALAASAEVTEGGLAPAAQGEPEQAPVR